MIGRLVLAGLLSLPLLAQAAPLASLLGALAKGERIQSLEHLEGVTVKPDLERGDHGGTVTFQASPFQGVAVPYRVFLYNSDASQSLEGVVLTVPPAAGRKGPETDYVRLLQQQLGDAAQVSLLADHCQWDAGGMGPANSHEAFLKVAWPDASRLVVEASARNFPKEKDSYLIITRSDDYQQVAEQIKAMECKAGDAPW